jgi:glycosyltransferase involved in cell wall biosynthesis
MTYAERDSIRGVIEGFADIDAVDEILVVNNNAQEGTVEEVEKTGARQVFESKQGYGNAIQRGLREATGDLIALVEPDGTFLPSDLLKLLTYSDECDMVFGTRTTRELIWAGSNMGFFLKWGNWAVAKLIEVLFNTSHVSDVGCTYRLLNRPLAEYVEQNMQIGGSHAGPEIMLLTITSGARFVEIPVNYLPRVGVSSVTGSQFVAFGLGLRMIGLILRFRLKAPRRLPRPKAFDRERLASESRQ